MKLLQNDVLNTTRFSTSVAIQRERKTSASAEGAEQGRFWACSSYLPKKWLITAFLRRTTTSILSARISPPPLGRDFRFRGGKYFPPPKVTFPPPP